MPTGPSSTSTWSTGRTASAESLATAILTELVRHRLVGDRGYRATLGRTARELGRFAEYVDAHLGGDLSLFTLAAVAGLSASHLVRERGGLFRPSTEITLSHHKEPTPWIEL